MAEEIERLRNSGLLDEDWAWAADNKPPCTGCAQKIDHYCWDRGGQFWAGESAQAIDDHFVPYRCEHRFLVEMFKSCPQCEVEMNRKQVEWQRAKDGRWCYTCDRPKDDCACVENGGTY